MEENRELHSELRATLNDLRQAVGEALVVVEAEESTGLSTRSKHLRTYESVLVR
ncbi:hypothetical protein [Halogeometricum borinquense]|uniref:hypothetical protein n=1 Tax=Halogeometricum borinquense TaxID=60847 RepID=UPI0013EA46C8|nr:hypothetical protein [Halogeometricum borinquense]